jgi:hypothetical protein
MEGVPGDLWEAAKSAGPFAGLIMLALWWLERADRVQLQRERDALLERVLTTMHASSAAIQEATRLITTTVIRRD